MIISTKNRASWFGRRAAWSAVALGVVACGGNSSTTVGEDGSGGAPLGGEKGSSGGRSSGDGGRAAGGRDGSGSSASDGGAEMGGSGVGGWGADAGDGGSPAGGSSTGGAPGTGGAGGEDDHLYGLGDECETPGEFSCSAANELLALICGGDRKWQVRETCESGEKCDFRGGSGVGLCLAPVEGCETNTSEPICGEQGVETCTRGGFETEVIEECEEGYGCEGAECVMVDDECPETRPLECEGSIQCDGHNSLCGSSCKGSVSGLSSGSKFVVRLGPGELCDQVGCLNAGDRRPGFLIRDMNVGPDVHVKVTVGPGWQIYGAEMRSSGFLSKCNTDASQECIVLAPIGGSVSVALFPLTDPHVVRNVTVEKVPIGTTCEE